MRLRTTHAQYLLPLAVGLALLVTAAPGSADPTPTARSAATGVTIGDDFFRAKSVSIRAGGSVTWKWRGRAPHNVTFLSGAGRPSGCATKRSGSCTRKFKRRGTFNYRCTIHSGQTGRIKVK